MNFWHIFKKRKPRHPAEDFLVTITETAAKTVLPNGEIREIEWDEIQVVFLRNTDEGPWRPDIWLFLAGNGKSCVIPHGTEGFTQVIERVHKLEGFDEDAFGRSMCCSNNAEFILWGSKSDLTGFPTEE